MARSLRELRQRRGWSQAELARRSGLHGSTVSLIESGVMRGYPSQLEKLARALGISRGQLDRLLRTSGGRPVRRPEQCRRRSQ
jgi:transcriptional regulator with XRE-family HTH domain